MVKSYILKGEPLQIKHTLKNKLHQAGTDRPFLTGTPAASHRVVPWAKNHKKTLKTGCVEI